jgi:hypothetical protein
MHCPGSGDSSFHSAPFRMTCMALPRFRRFFIPLRSFRMTCMALPMFRRFFIPLRSIQNDMEVAFFHSPIPVNKQSQFSVPVYSRQKQSNDETFLHSLIHSFTHSLILSFTHSNLPTSPHSNQ